MSDVSNRWSRVQTLFEEAIDRPADERTAWLRSVCGDDPEVYDHVAAMLYGEANQNAIFGGRAIDLIPPASGGDTIVPSRAGERVGPWVLGDRVGTGGMGAVYRAERDGDFGQTVALKRVKRGMDSEAVLTRFRAERRILARLEHPGIARLLDGGLDADGRPYFAMEYVDGEPITASCDTRRLGVDERLRLFEGVCEAVAYAHRSLVVHRDLKPSNVLVTEAGEVKLLDFGIARVLSDDAEADLTRTGQRLYTPGYAAPEQVRGEAPTTSTDVYALGVLLYGLLSGARPIETADRSPTEVERAVLDETPRRPSAAVDAEAAWARGTTASALADRLAGDLDTICLKALEKEPERRYGSAAELLADIRRHREGFPIEARPATRGYRAGLFVRRHRGAVAAAAVALAAVVGGAGVALWQAAEARNQRDRAEVEAQTAEEVTAFISSLLYSASPQNLQSPDAANVRDLRVADLLAQGAERVETELEGQPAVQVRLFDVIGEAYRALGEYDRAAESLERAYEVSQDQTLDSDLRAMVASNLGRLRMEAGDLDAAESLKRESFAILQSAGLLGGVGEGVVLNDLAMILSYKGQYADAEPLARRALGLLLRRYGPDNPMVGNVSNTLAGIQVNLGDFDAAERTYRANLERRRAAEPDGGDLTATALGLLGNMLAESQGDPDAGEPFLREALEMRRRVLGDEHPYVAISLNELAGARLAQGQLDEAVDLYSQALALRRKVLDPGHPHLAYSLVGYGRAQLEAGRPEQAEDLFREAIEVREAALPAGHELTLETRSWLGASLAAQGRQSEGEAILRNAYQELLDTRGPEARRTQEARERLDALGA